GEVLVGCVGGWIEQTVLPEPPGDRRPGGGERVLRDGHVVVQRHESTHHLEVTGRGRCVVELGVRLRVADVLHVGRIRAETGKCHLTGYAQTDKVCVTGYRVSDGYGRDGGRTDMHPILSKEFIRAFEHDMQERV